LKCDGTRAETRFRLSAKWMSPFKSAGMSVQSITGSRGVRISGSNAGYTKFRGSVKGTDHPIHSPVLPFTTPPVCHRVPPHFNWTLPTGKQLSGLDPCPLRSPPQCIRRTNQESDCFVSCRQVHKLTEIPE